MAKFNADKVSLMTDEEGDLIITFKVKGFDKQGCRMAYQEIKDKDKLEVDIKPYKAKRTIEQNKLLWVLLTKLSVAMNGSKQKCAVEDVYAVVLQEANVKYDYLLALPETEKSLRKEFRAIRKVGEREFNGKTMNVYQYFIGSSKYDVKEMTELIECTLDLLAQLGVYDSEIEQARREYKK